MLFGVAQCEKALSDTNADPELRAASLSYLIHLVGDMHQPLHCASLFTDAYPNGDRGGNDFYVMPGQGGVHSNLVWDYSVKSGPSLVAQRGVRLHSIWDGLLGTSANPCTQWNYATEIDAKYSRASLPELATHRTPKEWSLESRELAIEKAYLRGELKGATDQAHAPSLPADYTKQAKQVAEKQAALAGYRLADEIKQYLKCAGAVPLLPANTFTAAQTPIPKKIGAAETRNYDDETMVVAGKVVQVSVRPTITMLDIDKPYPNSPFTAVIFPENVGEFGALQKLKNQSVEISGIITEFRGKPEIILESPNQVKP